MDNTVLLGVWLAVGLTLFMYSFLYKDNVFFRFGEHVYLGISIGYIIVRVIFNNFINDLYKPLVEDRDYILIIPALMGLALYTRFFTRIAWVSRVIFAFIVGFGAGLGIPRTIAGGIFKQLEGVLMPLAAIKDGFFFNADGNFTLVNINSLIFIVGITSVLVYFFFSVEHKGVVKSVSRVGIYFVMIAFGASFGYTVMGRMSLLIGRCYDLIEFSSPKYYYASIVLLIMLILVFIIYEVVIKKGEVLKTNE